MAAALLSSLIGCASYKPMPLSQSPDSLDAPVASVLAHDARTIDRPFLRPFAFDLRQPLDPNAIAVLAVIANPDLKAQRARAGVADAQAFAARLLPDPTISLGIDHLVSGPDPLDNLAAALATDLAALRTRAVARAAANASAEQVRLDLAWAEWQTAGQARLQAVRRVALARQVELARAGRDGAQSMLDRALRAAGRGDLPPDQAQAARIAAIDATDRLRTNETDLAAARLELTRLLGLPPTTAIALTDPPLPPPPPSADTLFAIARAQRLDLKALEQGYAAQEAAVHKAVLDQFPTLTLTLNASRDTSGNKLIGPAIDFTLPLWNRNRGGIAIEQATRAALKAEYEARLFQTRAEIAAAVEGLAVVRRQRDVIAPQIAPLDRFAAASERAARRGDLAPMTAETARAALRDKALLLVQLDQAIMEQTIALELLTGVPRESWTR